MDRIARVLHGEHRYPVAPAFEFVYLVENEALRKLRVLVEEVQDVHAFPIDHRQRC